MPVAVKKSVIGSRAQSLVGPERVIDDRDLNIGGAVATDARRPLREQFSESIFDAATKSAPSRPTPGELIAHKVQELNASIMQERFTLAFDVPMPNTGGQAPSPYRAWLAQLRKPGDFLHIAEQQALPHADGLGSYVRDLARDMKIPVTVRRNFTFGGKSGLGVWRIEKKV